MAEWDIQTKYMQNLKGASRVSYLSTPYRWTDFTVIICIRADGSSDKAHIIFR